MKGIPAEVLQKIFLQLHQHDKVICMSVCSSWKYVIETYVLFDTVCLYNKQQFDNFITKNRRDPKHCEKIRRLIIDMEHMESTEMDILPFVILDLHELYFYEDVKKYNLRFTNALSLHPWSKTIRTIKEKPSNIFTTHILKGGACPALTEIEVNGADGQLGKEFVKILANAPALKSLSITKCNISLDDLELLHNTSSMLSSFSMYDGNIDCATLPTNIQPAACMTTLTIIDMHVATTSTYINLQNYLTTKYPEISNMSYEVYMHSGNDIEYHLKTGFALQINQIAPHLESLKIGYSDYYQYIIPALDDKGCQIKEFSMITSGEASEVNWLAQSSQARNIRSLSLNYIYSADFINYIGTLSALTELNLNCMTGSNQEDKAVIDINKLLESIGKTLKTLRLSEAYIVFDRLPYLQYTSLSSLTLERTTVPRRVDLYISQSFPKLRNLIIDDIISEDSTLYLDDLNLAYLELRSVLSSTNPCVLVVTTSNNNKRWYTAEPIFNNRRSSLTDPTTFPAVKSLPFEEYKGLPRVAFVCSSIYDFFLVNLASS